MNSDGRRQRRAPYCGVCHKPIKKGQYVQVLQWAKCNGAVERDGERRWAFTPWLGIVVHSRCEKVMRDDPSLYRSFLSEAHKRNRLYAEDKVR